MDTQLQIEVLTRRSRWSVEQIGRDFATIVRFALAVFFALIGIAKLASGEAFVSAIRGYDIVPLAGVDIVASLAVVSEIALAVWLASGRAKCAALWSAAGGFVALGAVVALAAWRGASGDCGCFAGIAESSIGFGAVLRNAALAAISINAAVVEASVTSSCLKEKRS